MDLQNLSSQQTRIPARISVPQAILMFQSETFQVHFSAEELHLLEAFFNDRMNCQTDLAADCLSDCEA